MVRSWVASVCLLLPLSAGFVGACGTDAIGIETCRQVEEARCQKAPQCPGVFDLGFPAHHDDDVQACIRFYHEACLHGLTTNQDPGAPATKACVDAINSTTDCDKIQKPEDPKTGLPACAWLNPPAAPVPDAAADAPDAAATSTSDGATGSLFDGQLPDVFSI